MRNNESFTCTDLLTSRVVVAALRAQPAPRRGLLVGPHWPVDCRFNRGNGVGRRPHVSCDPPGQHRRVQTAPAGEVTAVLGPTFLDVVLDRFHEVFPQCPGLTVDLWHRFDVHVGPRLVCASRWRVLGHVCHATARMQRTVVQTCNGGTGFAVVPTSAAFAWNEARGVTRGGAK